MNLNALKKHTDLTADIVAISDLIARTQRDGGEIPWYEGHKTDPWDHVEAAIGLSIGGHFKSARQAFRWLAEIFFVNHNILSKRSLGFSGGDS